MKTSLTADSTRAIATRLRDANAVIAARYPGEGAQRQPVHTVYGGAHLFRADSAAKLGALALRSLQQYAPDPAAFATATELNGDAEVIHARVAEKLRTEPIEDFRIDFEDGYGSRRDAEEDGHAVSAAIELARGMAAGSLPPFVGIRIKALTEELCERSLRTLDLFVTTLAEHSQGTIPAGFVVTLPKITSPAQPAALADVFDLLEDRLGFAPGSLKLEFMIETTQSIFGARGEVTLPGLVDAARGRCVAAHFGAYDYTAACGITSAHQQMDHPACDFARHAMQVALAGTGIWLSDGATNVMPVGPHRAKPGGAALTGDQERANLAAVHSAWRLHASHVRRSLVHGFYQGWDLHPAQLPTRYAAVYSFFLEGLAVATERLKNFVEKAAQATLVGDTFDDAATGQGLLNYFLRAINCGAIREDDALATGLTLDEIRGRSFARIVRDRPGGIGVLAC